MKHIIYPSVIAAIAGFVLLGADQAHEQPSHNPKPTATFSSQPNISKSLPSNSLQPVGLSPSRNSEAKRWVF